MQTRIGAKSLSQAPSVGGIGIGCWPPLSRQEDLAAASLVTGSSGLLGTCLIRRLAERGDEIHALDLVAAPPRTRPGPKTHFFEGDCADEAEVERASEGCDVIYHLAAAQRMKPQFSSWSEQQVFDRNLAGVEAVLRVAERRGVRKVVHISSSGIYGLPETHPCTEEHPQKPLGDYGHSKIAAEKLCLQAADRGLDITWFRPMTLFGPEMTGLFVMIYEWVRTGSPVFLLGRGRNRVQTTSAWDVADACIQSVEDPRTKGQFFNLGAEPSTVPTVEEMMQGLVDHAATGSRIVKVPAALLRNTARALDLVGLSPIVREHYTLADADFILDIQKAKDTFGFTPRYTNTEMICEAYDWYVAQGKAVRPPHHPMLKLLSFIFPGKSA